MTYGKPYRTATYDHAVAALQALLKEEGPAQVYRACGDAVAYLQQAPSVMVSKPPMSEKSAPRLLLSLEEAYTELGVSRWLFKAECDAGRITTVKIGGRRKVAYTELVRYVKMLYRETGTPFEYARIDDLNLESI